MNSKATKGATATKSRPYKSVKDMVRDLADDPDFAEELSSHLCERQLVKTLAILRARANLSQQELAEKAQCKQPRISKLESGIDSDVSFGDVLAYLKATGHNARIFFIPAGNPLVGEVKMHALEIRELLDKMVKLAGNDTTITKGVARFIEEAAANVVRLIQGASDSLPKASKGKVQMVRVEAPQIESEEAEEPAEPVRRVGKKRASQCP